MDTFTPARRSEIMGRIRSRDTAPEKIVRSLLHSMGYRFRLHNKNLPGKPDIVLPKWNAVIFVHGCFWHRHPRCNRASTPKTRKKFWQAKFADNVKRDKVARAKLRTLGWRILVIWQCELSRHEALVDRLIAFLNPADI